MKYPRGQCDYQATTKGDLDKHRRSVHEGIKYPCGQCEYQATQKGNRDKHKVSIFIGQSPELIKCLWKHVCVKSIYLSIANVSGTCPLIS